MKQHLPAAHHAKPRAVITVICSIPAESTVVGWFADKTERSVVSGASCLYIQRPLGTVSLTRRLFQSKSAGVHSTADINGIRPKLKRTLTGERQTMVVGSKNEK